MREVKRRVWDKRNKKWLKDTQYTTIFIDLDGDVQKFSHLSETLELLFDVEVVEYTGLKDKNGVEIYEGDIVNQRIHFGTESKAPKNKPFVICPGVVAWGSDGWIVSHEHNQDFYQNTVKGNATDWYRTTYGWGDVEVIGNIYENPELLEVDKE